MANTNFCIKGMKKDIAPLFRTASQFTANSPGAAAYLKCIQVVATEDEFTLTASSETEAIKVNRNTKDIGLEVQEEGEIMVQSNWLMTALDVIQDNHEIELSYSTESKRLVLISKDPKNENEVYDQVIELALPLIDERSAVPKVGEPDMENGAAFAPEDFITTYHSASVARDVLGQRPLVTGVLVRLDEESHKIRIMSTDARLSVVMDCFDYQSIIGEGFGAFLLSHDRTVSILDYLKQGTEVHMHRDDKDRAHLFVKGTKGEDLYHIRAATVLQPVEKYPESKMAAQIKTMLGNSMMDVKVDKAELLRVLRSAASIGSLDLNAIGGQARNVNVTISDGELIAEVTTNASYREEIDAEVTDINMEGDSVTLQYRFGLHSQMLETHNNENDERNIRFHLIENKKLPERGVPMAMVLCKEDPIGEDGELAEYISMINVTKPK